MSMILTIAFPTQTALPLAEAALEWLLASAPLLAALGLFLMLLQLFKPLLKGVLRAALLALRLRRARRASPLLPSLGEGVAAR